MTEAERPTPPSSPVCYADEAPDDYMGYLDRKALIEALTELLEAERAGVRVGANLVALADGQEIQAAARTVLADETHWCRMLVGALRRLDAKPSARVGDFYGKVMATPGLAARLALLNRGQGWVVRKLEALLPKVRDDRLHAELKAMLEAHVANIDRIEGVLARHPPDERPPQAGGA
jgi:hypothetical protein